MNRRDYSRVRKAYPVRLLASLLGVHPSTVRRWNRDGKPSPKKSDSVGVLLKTVRQSEHDQRALIRLMKAADKKARLPKVKAYDRTRDRATTLGREVQIPVNKFLTPRMIATMMQKAYGARTGKKQPNYIASVVMSAYGDSIKEGEKIGYPAPLVYLGVPDQTKFYPETVITSGKQSSKHDSIKELAPKLYQALDQGALLYVHSLNLTGYRYKDNVERRETRSDRRRARRKRTGR